MTVIPLATHPAARARAAADAARHIGQRLGLSAPDREQLAAKTRALVRAGCSAAWAIAAARRAACRASRAPDVRA